MKQMTLSQFPTIGDIQFDVPDWNAWFKQIEKTINLWNRRHRTRQHLAKLDNRILRDIGISQSERFIEVNKSFWER